jgi:predicted  nucleic acid-binding Zn-ribbon protein
MKVIKKLMNKQEISDLESTLKGLECRLESMELKLENSKSTLERCRKNVEPGGWWANQPKVDLLEMMTEFEKNVEIDEQEILELKSQISEVKNQLQKLGVDFKKVL